jgi:hypothetical protein
VEVLRDRSGRRSASPRKAYRAGTVRCKSELRSSLDSPLEGTGFEPSVPRGKGPDASCVVLFRSDFSVGGNQPEATLKDWSCHAGPMVRILFPPPASQFLTPAVRPRGCQASTIVGSMWLSSGRLPQSTKLQSAVVVSRLKCWADAGHCQLLPSGSLPAYGQLMRIPAGAAAACDAETGRRRQR